MRPGEDEGLAVGQVAGDERPLLGALHDPVDVAIDVAVERVRRARAERSADERGEHEPEVGNAALWARIMVGAVVTSSNSMTRGLVSAT